MENTESLYENHPLYKGDRVRFNQFLADLKNIMTNKTADYTVSDFIGHVIGNYELRKAVYFNSTAYEFLYYAINTYYKKYIKTYEEASASDGNAMKEMNLLRKVKGR